MLVKEIVFVDTEISEDRKQVKDLGAIRTSLPLSAVLGKEFLDNNLGKFEGFMKGAFFVAGHNLIQHDIKYIIPQLENAGVKSFIDTLYLSPLLFPKKPYHHLLKDEKIINEEINNPLSDSKKCMDLYIDEVDQFICLDEKLQKIYYGLLCGQVGFSGFFKSINVSYLTNNLTKLISDFLADKVCSSAELPMLIKNYPVELAYVVANIVTNDKDSILPAWVRKNYPNVGYVYKTLRGKNCGNPRCIYCNNTFNLKKRLMEKFGYPDFVKYNGEPLQEKAARAAVSGESIIAIFPTGGGKSITFQLPALIEAETVKGLTVVISPLQSLMKDQVDNLEEFGISDAVAINGLLTPVEKSDVVERVKNGTASILYISPESLRSKTIERLLINRTVSRFVIDEAHCFSSWGQDFRVDYLYIGDFIKMLQEKTGKSIPVSCFTATAKQKVISDIKTYFNDKLGISLTLFATSTARDNLRYQVLYKENDDDKYQTLRSLIDRKKCPTVVFVSSVKKTIHLAERLSMDGYPALPYNGKMDSEIKKNNQNQFMSGAIDIIVATSAFGMGVDKKDIGLVIHYDISGSLEDYVQEAGRGGRDKSIIADCYVLYNDSDLNGHFSLLNQSKLSINEIQQVWRGIKKLSEGRQCIHSSALDIARASGLRTDSGDNLETKVKTAISALELAGYIKRGNNSPRVFANRIIIKSISEARQIVEKSGLYTESQKLDTIRILQLIISDKNVTSSKEYEGRVDYIADILGMDKYQVIDSINLMKMSGIMSDDNEMFALLDISDINRTTNNKTLESYIALERFLADYTKDNGRYVYKEINRAAEDQGLKSNINMLKSIIIFWIIKNYIKKPDDETDKSVLIEHVLDKNTFDSRIDKRYEICTFADDYLRTKGRAIREGNIVTDSKELSIVPVDFSCVGIKNGFDNRVTLFQVIETNMKDIEEALLYMVKTKSLRLEGGFLAIYNALTINRVEMDNRIQYKKDDYQHFEEYYKNRVQQIHIVGEYANMMLRDYKASLAFVSDYFEMDYNLFLKKYFEGKRMNEIDRSITPTKYDELFSNLTERQTEIINDDETQNIVVAAGPGSGKTMLLVHKLASLILMEDVKVEQLVMLTFSRTAAMEFKERLVKLIGKAAYFVEIKTFHSYAFDILGRLGSIEESENVVKKATLSIQSGDVEPEMITKTVLVIDEAQDMNEDEYEFIQALQNVNDNMRIIAVGDDDQNIFEFRGSDSKYMMNFLNDKNSSKLYELTDNFRSNKTIVAVANLYTKMIKSRIKQTSINSRVEGIGQVVVVNNSSSLEYLIVQLYSHYHHDNKSAAILTHTNSQANAIYDILVRKNIKARLIQSTDRFSLYNLDEFRIFLNSILLKSQTVIDETVWNEEIINLAEKYKKSSNIENVLYILKRYKDSYNKVFTSDLLEFLKECRFEDFYKVDKDIVYISTIHKSKGHEFDDVFILLDNPNMIDDERSRSIYVGLTRAKNNLYIAEQGNFFGNHLRDMINEGVEVYDDREKYSEPQGERIDLTHKDIWLEYNYAWNLKKMGRPNIMAGEKLVLDEDKEKGFMYLAIPTPKGKCRVVSLSNNGRKIIEKERQKGYEISEAVIRFVAYWKDKDSDKEMKIILPQVVMRKNI